MGLDVSHDCWAGACSAFSRWRDKLAAAAGYEFADVDQGMMGRRPMVLVDYGHWPEPNYYDPPIIPCRIDGTPDPLLLLILHSDCEGKIRAEHTGPLADRLTELLPLLEGDGGGHIGDYRAKTQTFIAGLRIADQQGEAVEFA